MLQSRRYSSSSAATTTSSYPYRQSFLEVRNGQEYVSVLPPMTTEEDLLQEGLLDDSDAPQHKPRGKILRAIFALVQQLRQRLKRGGRQRRSER